MTDAAHVEQLGPVFGLTLGHLAGDYADSLLPMGPKRCMNCSGRLFSLFLNVRLRIFNFPKIPMMEVRRAHRYNCSQNIKKSVFGDVGTSND